MPQKLLNGLVEALHWQKKRTSPRVRVRDDRQGFLCCNTADMLPREYDLSINRTRSFYKRFARRPGEVGIFQKLTMRYLQEKHDQRYQRA